jgi:hypothetical protein
MPLGCADLFAQRPPRYYWAVTFVDDNQQLEMSSADLEQEPCMKFEFFRWNGNGANREREEASFRESGARHAWAEKIAGNTPQALSWAQQRWEIERAPTRSQRDS